MLTMCNKCDSQAFVGGLCRPTGFWQGGLRVILLFRLAFEAAADNVTTREEASDAHAVSINRWVSQRSASKWTFITLSCLTSQRMQQQKWRKQQCDSRRWHRPSNHKPCRWASPEEFSIATGRCYVRVKNREFALPNRTHRNMGLKIRRVGSPAYGQARSSHEWIQSLINSRLPMSLICQMWCCMLKSLLCAVSHTMLKTHLFPLTHNNGQ